MTEQEWLEGTDPLAMLAELGTRARPRKVRLAACACVRRFWALLRYPGPRRALELAERFADDRATTEEREQMRLQAEQWAWDAPQFDQPTYRAVSATLLEDAGEALRRTIELIRTQAVHEALHESPWGRGEQRLQQEAEAAELRALGQVMHEQWGNPFQPVAREAAWTSWGDGAARRIAEAIAEREAYEELPFLADALVDAGCTAEALISHLRAAGPHRRGCWALDLVLGCD
jgi:hypothetical protein